MNGGVDMNINNEIFHVTIQKEYATSYGNELVIFKKGITVMGYRNEFININGEKKFLAYHEVYGFPLGFIPISITDYKC